MTEREYVLGTHEDELARLGLQHEVWRSQALEGWRRAGFSQGQTLLDIGCGPGYATVDLAAIAGPKGRVVALDQSERFLAALDARKLANVTTQRIDLDSDPLPDVRADGAWVRWVFAFLRNPRDLVTRIAAALKPGATIVIHEYFDYRTWRVVPRSPLFEEFVDAVMRSWRERGGEPDIGLVLPSWLEDAGFRIVALRPMIDVIDRRSDIWKWPKAFMETGLPRMTAIGDVTVEQAEALTHEFARVLTDPKIRMVTPAVLEIVATYAG